jgi:hypothetical protein
MHTLRLVAGLLAGAAAARADVIVIDPGAGSGAPALNAALNAAAPGDVILLKAGNYDQGFPFVITKGITLLPAPGAGRIALRFVDINGVAGPQTAVLRGFDINPLADMGSHAPLFVSNTQGTAWLEDCTIRGGDGFPAPTPFSGTGGSAAATVQLASAVFRHCSFVGGRGGDAVAAQGSFATSGGDGLQVLSLGTVAVHNCTLVGGDQGNGTASTILQGGGGQGLVVDGDATVAGCALTGGSEGADNDGHPGSSGSAIRTFMASADVRVLQSQLAAGAVQGAGTQAPAINDPPHKVLLLAEPARSLVLPDQVREGQGGTLLIDGAPGDLAMVLLSAWSQLIPLKGQDGTLVTALATLQGPIVLGVLAGPDGQLALPFTLPELPAGVDAITVYVQGLFKDADGSSLGGASALTWIDAAF